MDIKWHMKLFFFPSYLPSNMVLTVCKYKGYVWLLVTTPSFRKLRQRDPEENQSGNQWTGNWGSSTV
ncbi:UNVERIFIED_CONTAM: hypothetical protein FKN15_066156 [Acipenser sinensis]